MADLTGLVTGLAQGLNGYMQTAQANKQTMQNEVFKNQLDEQSKIKEQAANQQAEQAKIQADYKAKADLAGKVTPEMAGNLFGTMSPEFGQAAQKYAADFKAANGRDLTTEEAKSGLMDLATKLSGNDNKDQANAERHMKEQTQMEEFVIKNVANMRADPAVNRTELQRDAAGMAYNTIRQAESHGSPLAALQNRDVLAQLIQARKGSTPSVEDMKVADQMLAKGAVNNLVTWATGNPNLVGATTDETLKNLKSFVIESGLKSDKNHEGYMSTHLKKPTDLEQSRWDHLMLNSRGVSFADQMKASDVDYPINAKGSTTSDGWSYVGPVK